MTVTVMVGDQFPRNEVENPAISGVKKRQRRIMVAAPGMVTAPQQRCIS